MTCRFIVLDESWAGRVERCAECGCVALHVGPMSIRLGSDAFLQVADMVSRARSRLPFQVTATVASSARGQA